MVARPYLNTPVVGPFFEKVEEVTVAAPSHPLYGKSFRVAYCPKAGQKYIAVFFDKDILLHIPRTAIYPPEASMIPTKLTREAIEELVEQAEEYEVCKFDLPDSGKNFKTEKGNK